MQQNADKSENEAPPTQGSMRLQRYLAACGLASRRHAEELIESGRVAVNAMTAKLGDTVDPEKDVVTCDGKSVLECVRDVGARVFPVGRLDYDVEGALLLTNDGELAHCLMHPKYEVDKIYVAAVRGEVTRAALALFEKGFPLDDGVAAPAKATIIHKRPGVTLLRLTLHEGKKREVKRMCAAAGYPVLDLQRVSVAGINVKGLRVGEWRCLTPHEIATLRKRAGLIPKPTPPPT
jgi:pseudouridine synthase